MKVIFLGTSGGLPTPNRNLPSVCVLREGEMMLFDCGEGTQRQIMRKGLGFGRITRIFITHIHGDHLSGLMGLLMTLTLLDHERPLAVYGPDSIEEFIASLKKTIRLRCGFPITVSPIAEGVVAEDDEYRVEAAPVRHSVPCFALALQEKTRPGRFNVAKAREMGIPEGPLYGLLQRGETITLEDGRVVTPGEILGPPRAGRRLVYVTDTLHEPRLVEFCRGADLLIHEGMFTSELAEEARFRKHSTAQQAATLAREANVRRLVLTHLSPRYWRRSDLRNEAVKIFPDTEVAKDLMELEIPYRD
ncbi:MAG: ribonuclease Z [bacterium]